MDEDRKWALIHTGFTVFCVVTILLLGIGLLYVVL